MIELWQGLLIPFAGTTLGAACVFFMRNNLGEMVQRALTGFAAGVMVAASIWSLLLPAMEQAADMGRWSFVPAVVGFWLGIFFLLGLDRLIPHLHRGSAEAEGIKSSLGKTTMLTLAVALHNIPEGMAVGAVYAGRLYGDSGAHRCDSDHPSGGDFGSGTALRPELCRRSDGLCGSGRIDPGDVSGKALQYRDYSVCSRFYPHDDAGCGAGCLSE